MNFFHHSVDMANNRGGGRANGNAGRNRGGGNNNNTRGLPFRPPTTFGPRPAGDSQPQQSREDMTIGDLLRSSNLTSAEVQRVEVALRSRDTAIDGYRQENRDLNNALTKRKKDIDQFRDDLSEARNKLMERSTELKERTSDLEAEKVKSTDLLERKNLQDGLNRLAAQDGEKKLKEIGNLKTQLAEAEGLQARLAASDAENGKLRDQIMQIGFANQTEAVQMAHQISSERTMGLISGFKRQVGERDAQIASLRKSVEDGNARMLRLRSAFDSRGEEVQALRQRLEQMRGREREAADEVERMKAEVDEGKEIAEEQQGLIEKLLEESRDSGS